MDKPIGFIGAGQMAEALARGFIGKGIVHAEQVRAVEGAEAFRVASTFRVVPFITFPPFNCVLKVFRYKLDCRNPAFLLQGVCHGCSAEVHALVLSCPPHPLPHPHPSQVYATDVVPERKEVFRSFKTNPVDSNIEVRMGGQAAWCFWACRCGREAHRKERTAGGE